MLCIRGTAHVFKPFGGLLSSQTVPQRMESNVKAAASTQVRVLTTCSHRCVLPGQAWPSLTPGHVLDSLLSSHGLCHLSPRTERLWRTVNRYRFTGQPGGILVACMWLLTGCRHAWLCNKHFAELNSRDAQST